MEERSRSERWFASAVTAVFVLLAGLVAIHHEIWRDEMRAWLIARDSGTPIDVLRAIKFEAHPFLWYACLWTLSRVTLSPVAMQAFHLLLAAGAVAVFTFAAPLPRVHRLLFAFGYFAFYEYAIVSRNYALGVLLVFIACACLCRRRPLVLGGSAAIALLAHTSAHFLIVAGALGSGLAWCWWRRRGPLAERRRRGSIGLVMIGVGCLLSAIQLVPDRGVHPDNLGVMEWLLNDAPLSEVYVSRPLEVLTSVTQAVLPHPVPRNNFHDSFWFESVPGLTAVSPGVAILLLAGSCWLLRSSFLALWTYVTATAGILGFFALVYSGVGLHRHVGLLFVLFVVAVWIAEAEPANATSSGGGIRRARRLALLVVLILHVTATPLVAWLEVRVPFSRAPEVARFIRAHGYDEGLIAADSEYAAASIIGYLKAPGWFFPRRNAFGALAVHDRRLPPQVSSTTLLERVRARAAAGSGEALLVWNHVIDPAAADAFRLTEVARFVLAARPQENYVLYRMCLAADGRPVPCGQDPPGAGAATR